MKQYVINTGDVSSEVFDKEAVVVNFVTGKYFGISGSGPYIWHMFEKPCSTEQVLATFSGNGAITGERNRIIAEFIDALVKEELLIETDNAADTDPVPHIKMPDEFTAPLLEVYEDLQELIVLDPVHDADPERGWPAQQRIIKP